ncbi:MAG: CehA/McbA family metallohydrolase [Acidobacteria bacterium]|nr:CehA/McbA family metallohydrolase [Acidobacteriota bacterium]
MKATARFLTAALLTIAGSALVIRDPLALIPAADKETTTWGAADPTWSPDGRRLAFSLFGSIWQVPADGGQAEQLSSSGGYHAHPAWSPKGDKIAFIKGTIPGGRIPNVSGKLMLVDAATGQERELATPHPTAGRPSWSPDGARLVCGLQEPDAGSLLHEIRLADGAIIQLQFRPPGSAAGPWVDASWNPRREEVFFAARRLGEPQIWMMPARERPIVVQLPLTRYKSEQIVLLDSLSALPDGTGVIYSAVEVNGPGNYELYRIRPQEGPVRITHTERDEFSPAVSPDGRLIAHVSNHLGNTDLFTMPIGGGEKKHVRITGLKFRLPSGRVRVRVLNEFGQPTPARLYVQPEDGKPYCPPGEQIFHYPLDPDGPRQGFFLASGDNTFPVPAGQLRLVARKGVPPFHTGFLGSDSPYDFPLNTMAAQQARRQGGLVVYCHPMDPGSNDVFDWPVGAMESPVTAALGALDAMELLAVHGPAYGVWYALLNAGFEISPAAGSDAFTNWRGLIRIPGSNRQYVEVGSKLSWDRWIARFREGRVFVTSGPLLTFTVNGQSIGSRIDAPSGQPYRARLVADISSAVPLRLVEFIKNGKVIDRREVKDQVRFFRMEKDVEVSRSSWFALRVTGHPARGVLNAGHVDRVSNIPVAHSGALYVKVDGKPTLIKEDIEMLLQWISRLWAYLEDRNNFGPGDNRKRAKELIDKANDHYRQKLAQAW